MNVDEFAAAKKPVLKTAEERLFLAIKFGLRAARRGNADWYRPIIRRALTIARAEYRSISNHTSSPNLRTDLEFLRNRLEDALPRTDPDLVHIDAQARAIAGSIASIAISTGSLAAAKDDERDLFKIWVNMEDDRVRAAHREVAPVRLRANFDVAGVPMDRPGDTRAPIELWINCVVGSTQVVWAGQSVLTTTRRSQTGTFVQLSLARGHVLTITPNHPVLTTEGYRPAGVLRKGDQVLATLLPVLPQVEDGPPSIEQVHRAACEQGVVQRMGGSAMDFHGDGADTEVEVVRTNGDLSLPVWGQQGERVLVGAGLTEGSGVAASTAQRTGVVGVPLGTDRVTTPGRVGRGGKTAPLVRGETVHPQTVGLTAAAGGQAEFPEATVDQQSADADFSRHLVDALASGMTPCDVIEVDIFSGSHDVYNLETSDNWYTANGIATHNCRCILGYKTAPEVEEMTLLDTFTDEGATMTVTATEIQDVPAVDADEISVPWHGVLAPEGVMSGDKRKFAADSLRWRELPLPLAWQKTNMGGHDGSVVVGRIDNIWREDGVIKATGSMLATAEADEVVGLMGEGGIRGVSVDVDDATMAMEDSDGNLVEGDEFSEDASMLVTDGRICGATLCAIPAFQEAHVYLGVEDAESLAASGAECLPCQYKAGIDDGEWTGARSDYTDEQWHDACVLHLDGQDSVPIYTPQGRLSRVGVKLAAADEAAMKDANARAIVSGALVVLGEDPLDAPQVSDTTFSEEFVKTEDGPGWLTHPVDTERLRHYWTKGKGALKIRWGIPGDFNRCRTQLAKYIKPQYLSGYCANRHYDALGFWPGRPVTGDTTDFSGPSLRLVASAFEDRPPKEWFEDPKLTKGSPIVVTEDGRVFGHLAEWSRCHIGYGQRNCTLAPKSKAQYAFFRTGYVLTDDGEVPVGHITTGTGHADGTLNAAAAASHYDNTGSVVADVAAGEDQYGVWVAGWMRPGTTEEDRYVLRASTLSGDWRTIGVGLELVAALAVNVPGFPIPRAELVAAGGRQVSLVASGIVLPEAEPPAPFDLKAVADAIINEMDKRDRTKRMTVLRAQTGRTNDNRMREIRERAGR